MIAAFGDMTSSPGADPGLFGPGSQTWRVQTHPIAWVGGIRALYLQALHPRALQGVFGASNYRVDPWGRLMRTAQFVAVTTFGSTAQAEAAGARVRALHRRLGVTDPHLLCWVHCCEVSSFLEVHRRSGGGLDALEAGEYLGEQAAASRLVGLDPVEVPADEEAMAAYFETLRPELCGGSEVRAVGRFLLAPPMPARIRLLTPAAPGWAALSALAFQTLPAWARRMYGVPALPGAGLRTTLALRALRLATDRLPERLREGPQLRAARARLAVHDPLV